MFRGLDIGETVATKDCFGVIIGQIGELYLIKESGGTRTLELERQHIFALGDRVVVNGVRWKKFIGDLRAIGDKEELYSFGRIIDMLSSTVEVMHDGGDFTSAWFATNLELLDG